MALKILMSLLWKPDFSGTSSLSSSSSSTISKLLCLSYRVWAWMSSEFSQRASRRQSIHVCLGHHWARDLLVYSEILYCSCDGCSGYYAAAASSGCRYDLVYEAAATAAMITSIATSSFVGRKKSLIAKASLTTLFGCSLAFFSASLDSCTGDPWRSSGWSRLTESPSPLLH